MANNTGTARKNQDADPKLIGEDGATRAEYARDTAGNRTFVAKESTSRATGRDRKLKIRRTRWSDTKIITCANAWLKDIERLIVGTCGGPCETEDSEIFYDAAVRLLVARHIAYGRAEKDLNTMEWARKFTPRLVADNTVNRFRAAEQKVLAEFDNHSGKPSIGPADGVSKALRITSDQKALYGLRYLPAQDSTPASRKATAKAKNADHNREKARAKGATPREQSITARKPWEAHGVSRASYYRRVRSGELPADPAMRPVVSYETEGGVVLRVVRDEG